AVSLGRATLVVVRLPAIDKRAQDQVPIDPAIRISRAEPERIGELRAFGNFSSERPLFLDRRPERARQIESILGSADEHGIAQVQRLGIATHRVKAANQFRLLWN